MGQIQERDQQIAQLKQQVAALEKKCSELEAMLASPQNSNNNGTRSSTPSTSTPTPAESQLIIHLQQQLETEKLTTISLTKQLEIERGFSQRLTSSPNGNRNGASSAAIASSASPSRPQPVGAMNGFGGADTLGLRGLMSSVAGQQQQQHPFASNGHFSPSPSSLTRTPPAAAGSASGPPPGMSTVALSNAFQSLSWTNQQHSYSMKNNVYEILKSELPHSLSIMDFDRFWAQVSPNLNELHTPQKVACLIKDLMDKEQRLR